MLASADLAVRPRHEASIAEEVRRLGAEVGLLAQENRNAEALPIWERLGVLLPDHPGVAEGRGAALVGAWRFRAAADFLSWANRRFPGRVSLLRLHANALRRLGDTAQAVGALLLACQLEPDSADLHGELALAFQSEGKCDLALPHARYALRINPTVSNATILVELLIDMARGDEALSVANEAIVARIDGPKAELAGALLLRSFTLRALGQAAEARDTALAALEAEPNGDNVRACVAMELLTHGQLTAEAWSLYEFRNRVIGIETWPSPELLWAGQDLAGRTLLVHAEQGLGDTIQFVRYLPMLQALGARVCLAVQASLLRLMQGVEGADLVVAGGGALPAFDYYIPLLSLPGRLGTTLQTIPPAARLARPTPSLQAPGGPTPIVSAGESHPLKVGLVWAGNRTFIDDRKRSVDPALFGSLADVAGVQLHSLNFGVTDMPVDTILNPMDGVKDFAETAALIEGLDLVISVDTSVAHLAATLGKPVWLLTRLHGCWRWLLDREDSPWYPTVRLYRQTTTRKWEDVIDRLRGDLQTLAAAKRPGAAGNN